MANASDHNLNSLFKAEFQVIPRDLGVASVKLSPQSPNLNAYVEKFARSIKESCLERLMLFGENSLRTAAREFVAHHVKSCIGNQDRLRQLLTLDNQIDTTAGTVKAVAISDKDDGAALEAIRKQFCN
jgi:hypothetical protein